MIVYVRDGIIQEMRHIIFLDSVVGSHRNPAYIFATATTTDQQRSTICMECTNDAFSMHFPQDASTAADFVVKSESIPSRALRQKIVIINNAFTYVSTVQ